MTKPRSQPFIRRLIAETAIVVDLAPAVATPVPTQTPIATPPFETYFAATGAAIIIAIAIVGMLALRKKP